MNNRPWNVSFFEQLGSTYAFQGHSVDALNAYILDCYGEDWSKADYARARRAFRAECARIGRSGTLVSESGILRIRPGLR